MSIRLLLLPSSNVQIDRTEKEHAKKNVRPEERTNKKIDLIRFIFSADVDQIGKIFSFFILFLKNLFLYRTNLNKYHKNPMDMADVIFSSYHI